MNISLFVALSDPLAYPNPASLSNCLVISLSQRVSENAVSGSAQRRDWFREDRNCRVWPLSRLSSLFRVAASSASPWSVLSSGSRAHGDDPLPLASLAPCYAVSSLVVGRLCSLPQGKTTRAPHPEDWLQRVRCLLPRVVWRGAQQDLAQRTHCFAQE